MYLGVKLGPVKSLHSGINFRVTLREKIVDSQILLYL